jgi:hypothetical protein
MKADETISRMPGCGSDVETVSVVSVSTGAGLVAVIDRTA